MERFDVTEVTAPSHPDRARGWVFDIQRYSVHDGPGIRTTIFMKGCPLSCPWCHNPEGISGRPEIRIMESRCIHCESCAPACPHGLAGGPFLPDPTVCERCGRCADACPTGARQLVGWSVTAREAIDAAERDRPFYEESGGGVSFSGGEPFFQAPFLLACLAEARRRNLHTVVETCGFASARSITEAAALTDLFLFDLKLLDPERHRRLIGVPLDPIIRNLRILDDAGAQLWIRVPLVPGYNDDERDLEALGRIVASLRGAPRLQLLPYHRLGSDKYARIGRESHMPDVEPTPKSVAAAAAYLTALGIDARTGAEG